jgi:ABC-type multidrug transport system fused ATPase/permease subunit
MNGKVLSFSEESIQNLQTIKAFGLTTEYAKKFKVILNNYRNMRLTHDRFSILTTLCLSAIGLVVSYSCYGWGVYRLWDGAITFGTMTLFLQLSGSLTSSFSALVSMVPSVISIATAAGRIKEITELPQEDFEEFNKANSMLPCAIENGVSVVAENVTYSYADSDRVVLNNISFCANPCETIAFVGPSGEGKTTLLRLLLGVVSVQSGTLTVSAHGSKDEIPISAATRKLFSYVPQDNILFAGTVAENLRLVKKDATDEELNEALRICDRVYRVENGKIGGDVG